MIYLASPYSHSDPAVSEQRFRDAARVAGILMRAGHHVYSPISHTHPIAVYGQLPTGWEFWKRYDRELIGMCEAIYVLTIDGWRESRGVTAELEIAAELGKPVFFIDDNGDKVDIHRDSFRGRPGSARRYKARHNG